MDGSVKRIIDANLNRAKEGLRVVEEYTRFIMNNSSLSAELKVMRHEVTKVFSQQELKEITSFRDSINDIGAYDDESKGMKGSAFEVAAANMKRVEESFRTLEEYLKCSDARTSQRFKKLRFGMYTLEKALFLPLKRLRTSSLYIILTESMCSHGLEDTVKMVLDGGADIIQLREKGDKAKRILSLARKVKKIMQNYDALFVINDRPDIARCARAHGVHGGQNDLPVKKMREVYPAGFIGRSTHSARQVGTALKDGTDYIGIGPVYATPTKKGRPAIGTAEMRKMIKKADIPYFVIGGIDRKTAPVVREKGARAIAVCRAVIAADDPLKEAKYFRKVIGNR